MLAEAKINIFGELNLTSFYVKNVQIIQNVSKNENKYRFVIFQKLDDFLEKSF